MIAVTARAGVRAPALLVRLALERVALQQARVTRVALGHRRTGQRLVAGLATLAGDLGVQRIVRGSAKECGVSAVQRARLQGGLAEGGPEDHRRHDQRDQDRGPGHGAQGRIPAERDLALDPGLAVSLDPVAGLLDQLRALELEGLLFEVELQPVRRDVGHRQARRAQDDDVTDLQRCRLLDAHSAQEGAGRAPDVTNPEGAGVLLDPAVPLRRDRVLHGQRAGSSGYRRSRRTRSDRAPSPLCGSSSW